MTAFNPGDKIVAVGNSLWNSNVVDPMTFKKYFFDNPKQSLCWVILENGDEEPFDIRKIFLYDDKDIYIPEDWS